MIVHKKVGSKKEEVKEKVEPTKTLEGSTKKIK
jgi:hypothetical protein